MCHLSRGSRATLSEPRAQHVSLKSAEIPARLGYVGQRAHVLNINSLLVFTTGLVLPYRLSNIPILVGAIPYKSRNVINATIPIINEISI